MVLIALFQIVGVTLELTSNLTGSWGQLTAGRFVAYISTGLAELAVTHFNGEVSPASTRGLLAGSMVFSHAVGNLWGACMSRAYATEPDAKGWLIPVAVQYIPAVLILILVWFTVESPRWLVVKGRRDEALNSLKRLRPEEDVVKGLTSIEIGAIVQSLEEQDGKEQGRWIEIFHGNMLRRTWICCTLFALLQATGVQWVNSFGATYYVNAGLKANSFTYVVIANALQIVSCAFQISTYDWFGRRFFSVAGGTLTFIFLTVLATLGTGGSAAAPVTNSAAVHAVVASIILTATFGRWAVTNAFVVGGEIGGTRHRRKVMALGGVVNMCVAILVTSVTPYLTNHTPGSAGLGAKVGWFFAASSAFLAVFGFFFVPELKGRSLEETDELFENCFWGWQFAKYQSVGIGARITAIEDSDSARLRRVGVMGEKGGFEVSVGESHV